jgi:hypothetical protein
MPSFDQDRNGMEILLDLHKRCVVSAVKRAYSQAVNQALAESDMDPELETKIEILKTVLEDVDLVNLRGQCPELAGGSDVDVRLEMDESGCIRLVLQGQTVKILQK